jgi:hypothetical protein
MGFDFPNSPTTGQVYNGYTWDGEKWVLVYNAPNTSGVIAIQVFTASGTYVPSPNMTSAVIECFGGGGGGGGAAGTANQTKVAGGGGGGGYSRSLATALQIGISQAVSIGARGAGAATGSNAGGNGGVTSVGSLCIANGGAGGIASAFSAFGSAGGATGTGSFVATGQTANSAGGDTTAAMTIGHGGDGASSPVGGGGQGGLSNAGATAGLAAWGYAAGGGGASANNSTATAAGGNGSPGIVIITEYGMTTLSATTNAQGAVRFDLPQGLSISQMLQGRQNVYAAPLDAMAYSGLQINGSMEVSQENSSTQIYGGPGGTAFGRYIADGTFVSSNGAQSISFAATDGAISSPAGYQGYARVWSNTLNASPASGDFLYIGQRIEGYRVSRLAWGTASAQPISIGFWFFSQLPGTYSGAVRNSGSTRSYVFTFQVNAPSTWEWKNVTIPGDTAGTWNLTNGLGIEIDITLMHGISYQASAGSWVAGNFIGAGTINAIGTSMVVAVSGLIVLPGIDLPSAARAPLVMRPYEQELRVCQRYLDYVGAGLPVFAKDSASLAVPILYSVPKRANPTVTQTTTTPGVYFGSGYYSASGSVCAFQGANDSVGCLVNSNGFSSLTPGMPGSSNTSAWFKIDARL